MSNWKVYVGNLPANVTKSQLGQLLISLGSIPTSIDMEKDELTGEPLGYAYLSFKEKSEAEKVITLLDGRRLGELFLKSNFSF
jgi:RNA recognition motif-containing protein